MMVGVGKGVALNYLILSLLHDLLWDWRKSVGKVEERVEREWREAGD